MVDFSLSRDAALVLAGSVPCVYVSGTLLDTYEWKEELAREGTAVTPRMLEAKRNLIKASVT